MIPEEESGRSSRTATHQDVGGVPGQGQGEESRARELDEGVHDVRPLARQALVEDLIELRKKSRNRYSKYSYDTSGGYALKDLTWTR